jgi:flavin-dependent dehydrogenase
MMEETPRLALRDVDPSTLWVSYGYEAPGTAGPGRVSGEGGAAEGYAYIFPKRDHVNIGIGYVLEHFRSHVDARPYDLQQELVAALRRRGVVEGESVRDHFTPYLIPVGGPLAAPGGGRVLLAGDAGGFVNGFTAEGIYYAMVSAELAAETVISSPAGDVRTMAARYRRSCEREMGAELRDSVIIQRFLFSDRRRISRIINGAHRAQALTDAFLDYVTGRLPYSRLRARLALHAPALTTRLLWAARIAPLRPVIFVRRFAFVRRVVSLCRVATLRDVATFGRGTCARRVGPKANSRM